MTQVWLRTIATVDGPFTVVTDDAAVIYSGWTEDRQAMLDRIWYEQPILSTSSVEPPCLRQALMAVAAYYDGDGGPAGRVPTRQASSPFQTQVRQALATVPYGRRVSYTDLAAAAGHPRAFRAAATTCAQNRTALFVPCHRVVRGDGGLGGFLYGLPLKRRLLDRESGLAVGSAPL